MKTLIIETQLIQAIEPRFEEAFMLSELRKAGIPVKGYLLYAGIESGTLTRTEEIGSIVFTWYPDSEES